MVQVLKGPGRHGDGGVAGLKAARVKAAASTTLKQGLMLPGGRKSEADGGSLAPADRYVACVPLRLTGLTWCGASIPWCDADW